MLGIDAELWYLPEASRPASALPTWASLDKALLQHFCEAARTTLNISREILDASTRCEPGAMDIASYGDMGFAVDVEFPWQQAMSGAEEWFNSVYFGRNVAAAVLDSSLFTSEQVPRNTMLGVWSDWIIAEWNHSHPINGSQRIRLRLVPAWSAYITYAVDLPATVARAYPEILNPYDPVTYT